MPCAAPQVSSANILTSSQKISACSAMESIEVMLYMTNRNARHDGTPRAHKS